MSTIVPQPTSLVFDRLPEIATNANIRSSVEYYGAKQAIARHAGLPADFALKCVRWQHGWSSVQRQNISPLLVILEVGFDRKNVYFVARDDEVKYLENCGLKSKAIGLPIVYVDSQISVPRLNNSLLVMPAHSLEYTSHQWRFDEYAEAIASLRKSFDHIVACVHPACELKGYWKPQFEKLGIPVVAGASTHDMNGLIRIVTMMKSFTHLTTNCIGSQVVYGAAFGMAVSIWGEYAGFCADDVKDAPIYKKTPALIEAVVELVSEQNNRKEYPWLFTSPEKARLNVSWGRQQIGAGNCLAADECKKHFCLSPFHSAIHRIGLARKSTKTWLSQFAKPLSK